MYPIQYLLQLLYPPSPSAEADLSPGLISPGDASNADAVLTPEEVLEVSDSQISSKWARIWNSADRLVWGAPLVVELSNTHRTEKKKAISINDISPSLHLFVSKK